jgi:hypothetical protein
MVDGFYTSPALSLWHLAMPNKSSMSRAMTKEEMLKKFLDQIETYVEYWGRGEESKEKALEGLAFSILNIFDGTSPLPAFDIVVCPHPTDKEYCEEIEENYWVPEVINKDIYLHHMWGR